MPLLATGEVPRHTVDLLTRRAPTLPPGPGTPVLGPGTYAWLESPVLDLLRRRRSVKAYSAEPLGSGELRRILDGIDAARALHLGTAADSGAVVTPVIAASRVDGLPEGLYAVDGGTRSGRMVALPAAPGTLGALRNRYADAPVLIFLCGDLDAACASGGSGYGALLTRCGALGYAAWLSALDQGFAGCVFGAANPLVSAAVRHHDRRLHHLFTVSIGVPATDPGASDGDR